MIAVRKLLRQPTFASECSVLCILWFTFTSWNAKLRRICCLLWVVFYWNTYLERSRKTPKTCITKMHHNFWVAKSTVEWKIIVSVVKFCELLSLDARLVTMMGKVSLLFFYLLYFPLLHCLVAFNGCKFVRILLCRMQELVTIGLSFSTETK